MKRKTVILLTAAMLLVLMTSCPAPPAVMGGRVLTFGDTFMFDQTYDEGRNVYIYNSDGTYEHQGKSWDAVTESWKQEWGSKGTYSYDSNTFLMTWQCTHKWGWGDAVGWAVLSEEITGDDLDSWSLTETFQKYYTDNGAFNVYLKKSDGSWETTSTYTHSETRNGTTEQYGYKGVENWELSGTELFRNQVESEQMWGQSALEEKKQREHGGKVGRLAPEGISWKAGETVTFYYLNTVNRERTKTWDDNTETWSDWSVWNDWSNGDLWSRNFVNLGDYMIEVDVDSSKNFIIE